MQQLLTAMIDYAGRLYAAALNSNDRLFEKSSHQGQQSAVAGRLLGGLHKGVHGGGRG